MTQLTENLEIDLDSFQGAGPTIVEAIKAAILKIDTQIGTLSDAVTALEALPVLPDPAGATDGHVLKIASEEWTIAADAIE